MGKNYISGDDNDNVIHGGALGDHIYGLGGDDQLFGAERSDWLFGGDGADTLKGGDGGDYLFSEDSNSTSGPGDVLYGGAGADHVYGGAGDFVNGGDGDDTMIGGAGATLVGGAGHDLAYLFLDTDAQAFHGSFQNLKSAGTLKLDDGTELRGVESGFFHLTNFDDVAHLGSHTSKSGLYGGAGDDLLVGSDGGDALSGESGADTVRGEAGDDRISGDYGYSDADGHNLVDGGTGDDWIDCYGPGDTVITGSGADLIQVHLNSASTPADPVHIVDLSKHDTVDLNWLDADTTQKGWQHFHLVSQFDGTPGEVVVRYDASAHQTLIEGYTNADATPDLVIVADGNHADFTNFRF